MTGNSGTAPANTPAVAPAPAPPPPPPPMQEFRKADLPGGPLKKG
jgi:hypothetical protein